MQYHIESAIGRTHNKEDAILITNESITANPAYHKGYTEQVESGLKYTSKQAVENRFYELKQIYNITGMMLAGIFAVIGLLNFINVITTGILARQKELAIMQSIGMTKRLKNMLVLEGQK